MTINEEIGRNIVFLRKRAGVSREWLSLEANVAQSYLYEIEHGKANASMDLLFRIAFALDIPFEMLFDIDLPERYVDVPYEDDALTLQEIVYLRSCLQLFRHKGGQSGE